MSDTFANGFWYLPALGRLAQLNHKVFLRQDLVGAWYGLLRDKFTYGRGQKAVAPNPDYFSAVLFKRLMGTRVLNASSSSSDVSVYAHCTAPAAAAPLGAVTLLVVNYRTSAVAVAVAAGGATAANGPASRLDFLLTPTGGSVFASVMLLNGAPLAAAEQVRHGVAAHGSVLQMPTQCYGFL